MHGGHGPHCHLLGLGGERVQDIGAEADWSKPYWVWNVLHLAEDTVLYCAGFLQKLFFVLPGKKDPEELLEDEKEAEENIESTMRTAVTRKGLLKPMRDKVTN